MRVEVEVEELGSLSKEIRLIVNSMTASMVTSTCSCEVGGTFNVVNVGVLSGFMTLLEKACSIKGCLSKS